MFPKTNAMVSRIVVMLLAAPILAVLLVSAADALLSAFSVRGLFDDVETLLFLSLRTAAWNIPALVMQGVVLGFGRGTPRRRWLCFLILAGFYVGVCALVTRFSFWEDMLLLTAPILLGYGLAILVQEDF